jgi:NAD(P)-dependent dehydrogenase (short-subunit alcohol dehydrogenase family)
MKLKDKVAVITGGASGVGRAMVELFSAEGAKIVAADINQARLDEVVAGVRASGGEITGIIANVAQKADCERIIASAVAGYGRLDILCNNAGVMDQLAGAAELDDEMWERLMGINLNGPFFLTRSAIPAMLAHGGGSIIMTGSKAGLRGGSGCAYNVTKHGLQGLALSTAWRYALEGIRCNYMALGAVNTNIVESFDLSKVDLKGAARVRLQGAANPVHLEPLEVAKLALFLASDDALHVNGAVIPIDGGWSTA